MAQTVLLFDAGPLWSFAIVARLDILEARYAGRAGWTKEVRDEILRNSSSVSALQPILTAVWLGQPIDVGSLDPSRQLELLRQVEIVRQTLTGARSHPRKNLGEASTIVAAVETNSIVAIEDGDGAAAARFRKLTVIRTDGILRECVALGELSCDEAWQVYQDMVNGDRILPRLTRRQLCY
jgi:predicted nucleic acid-binding protein